jgi:hypothetical protein
MNTTTAHVKVRHSVTYTTPPAAAEEEFEKIITRLKPLLLQLHHLTAQELFQMVDLLALTRRGYVEKVKRLTINPDEVEGANKVSEWQDERNSRPFPY